VVAGLDKFDVASAGALPLPGLQGSELQPEGVRGRRVLAIRPFGEMNSRANAARTASASRP
jgi:hypothetical protein